jgi:GR25 family glycosyltransferase involved in LPS biosynthesis
MPADRVRRALLKRLLRTLPYENRLVPGVAYAPHEPSLAKYITGGIQDYVLENPQRMRGVVGLWISHSMALESVDADEGVTVILEDDFVCTPDFFEVAIKMVNEFERDFDVIMFDCAGSGPREVHKIAPGIYQTDGESFPTYWGSHCLFVNNRSVRKILQVKQNYPVKDIDGFHLMRDHPLEVFLFYTGKCRQIFFGTNMGGTQTRPIKSVLAQWRRWTGGQYK